MANCTESWSTQYKEDAEALERAQRRPTKMIRGLEENSTEEWLKELGFWKLLARLERRGESGVSLA